MDLSSDLRDALARQIGPVLWRDLRAHAKRQGLFVVAAEVALLDAAHAIASDDTSRVEAWIAAGQLYRPDLAQLEAWDADLDKPFTSVVVQPFALAQEG